MTPGEKLTIYGTVITALRNGHDLTEILGQFPIEYQLEAVNFLEYLKINDDSANDDGPLLRKH